MPSNRQVAIRNRNQVARRPIPRWQWLPRALVTGYRAMQAYRRLQSPDSLEGTPIGWNRAAGTHENALRIYARDRAINENRRSTSRQNLRRRLFTETRTMNSVYKGPFAKKYKKTIRKYPVVVKDERPFAGATATKCLYIGHCTHPVKYMIRLMSMSIIHKYFKSCGVTIRNWKSVAGFRISAVQESTIDLTIVAVLQRDPATTTDTTYETILTTSAGDTYLDMADNLANGLCNMVKSTDQDMRVHYLQFRTTATVAYPVFGSKEWDVSKCRITLYGKSILCLQNRTESSSLTNPTSTEIISTNPVRGKEYLCTGAGPRIRDTRQAGTVASSNQFTCDSKGGGFLVSSLSSGFDVGARDVLRQPPHQSYFSNCLGSSYIRLGPGEIKKSVAVSSVTKSFNQWLISMQDVMSKTGFVSGIPTNCDTRFGRSKILAFEKVADVGGDAPIKVEGERNAIYMAVCHLNKATPTPATNDQSGAYS